MTFTENFFDEIQFEANLNDQDIRIDIFLTERLCPISRSYIQRLITTGKILVNGKSCKANYKLRFQDTIKVFLPHAKPAQALPEHIPLDILYEDNDMIIINKPRGLVVHPAAGNRQGTLVNALLGHCSALSGINGVLRPGIVHRLDKDTSGVMVAAKSDHAHISLAGQIKNRSASRIYLAIVHGHIGEKQGIIQAPIGRDPLDRQKMAVTFQNSKEAITRFSVKEYLGGFGTISKKKYTLIECSLLTGRTHQIRVHMKYIGHPLLGDPKYGNGESSAFKINGQALHSWAMSLKHPLTNEEMFFSAPLPDDMLSIYNILKREKETVVIK